VSLRAPNRPRLSGSVAFLGHLGLNTVHKSEEGNANEPGPGAVVPLAGFYFWAGGARAGFSAN
jgi:hypothetical protein